MSGGGVDARRGESLCGVAGPPALAMVALLMATASRYGLHGDELYFRMLPMAWWYEDQPPLTVWLARAATAVSDAAWVQRVPAVLAAGAGVLLAACVPRLLGQDARVQRVAAWAHAFTVYPLLIGHVFLTSSLDLLAWQAIVLLVMVAMKGRRHALSWAGLLGGLACWNKLLVVILVAALLVAIFAARRQLLRTRDAWTGGALLVTAGAPQLLAQVIHGFPMSRVSGDLIARHGAVNRMLVIPLLLAFLGPPLAAVWWRGLLWRPGPLPCPEPGRDDGRTRSRGELPVLAITAALLVGWNLAFPAQPYYAVAVLLPALSAGWAPARQAGSVLWRRAPAIIAANAVVAVLICLPILPPQSSGYRLVAAVVPVQRDQVGWEDLARRVAQAQGGTDATVITGHYALAGALAYHGPAMGLRRDRVASGHNALWALGPPTTPDVLLVGEIARTHRDLFGSCVDVGSLRPADTDPFALGEQPMVLCTSPVGGWQNVWPRFRRLGG